MSKYLAWDEKTTTDFSDKNVNALYNAGYVFTRVGRGAMNQTRSIRIDLAKFELTSENKRILKKTEGVNLTTASIPYFNYDWTIAKIGKDFYETKFGEKTFSANKIKELLTDKNKSNFNLLLKYNDLGYVICGETDEFLHYCYPFYDLKSTPKDMGMGMMIKAVVWAKRQGKKYIYLGSASRSTDTYKTQFAGFEWFDNKNWQINIPALKDTLRKNV